MTYEKEFHYKIKPLYLTYFFLLIYLFINLFYYLINYLIIYLFELNNSKQADI